MNQEQWITKLTSEGYKNVNVQTHEPYTEFAEHTHEHAGIHVILEGQMTFTDSIGSRTVKKGDWFNIPRGATHTAKCGYEGCTFIVGEK